MSEIHHAECHKAGQPLRGYESCCQPTAAPTPRETGAELPPVAVASSDAVSGEFQSLVRTVAPHLSGRMSSDEFSELVIAYGEACVRVDRWDREKASRPDAASASVTEAVVERFTDVLRQHCLLSEVEQWGLPVEQSVRGMLEALFVAPAQSATVTQDVVVRHPNGHLTVEQWPVAPSDEHVASTLASIAKAYPVLADHATHIDGEFDNALTNLRRIIERYKQALAAAPRDAGREEEVVAWLVTVQSLAGEQIFSAAVASEPLADVWRSVERATVTPLVRAARRGATG